MAEPEDQTKKFWMWGIGIAIAVAAFWYVGELRGGHDPLTPPKPVLVGHSSGEPKWDFSGDRAVNVPVRNDGGAGDVVVTVTQDDGTHWDQVAHFDAGESKTVSFTAQGGNGWTQSARVSVAAK